MRLNIFHLFVPKNTSLTYYTEHGKQQTTAFKLSIARK